MATETSGKASKYNVKFELKEEWYSPSFWEFLQDTTALFESYTFKEDDVIVCTFPRSGTHMTWLLVRYLLQGSTEPIQDAMEDSHLPPIKANNKQDGRRVFNTHYLPANFGDGFFANGNHKCIYISRNPKDMMVSFVHVLQTFKTSMPIIPDGWEECLPFILTTDVPVFSWFKHVRAWEEFMERNPEVPVLDLKFEEIVREIDSQVIQGSINSNTAMCGWSLARGGRGIAKTGKDPESAITEMANFLEVPLSDRFLQDLLVASKFDKMKDAPVTQELENIFGPEAKNFSYYRKGKIGDWVKTFTVAQNELFDAAYKEQMKGSKVTNIYH